MFRAGLGIAGVGRYQGKASYELRYHALRGITPTVQNAKTCVTKPNVRYLFVSFRDTVKNPMNEMNDIVSDKTAMYCSDAYEVVRCKVLYRVSALCQNGNTLDTCFDSDHLISRLQRGPTPHDSSPHLAKGKLTHCRHRPSPSAGWRHVSRHNHFTRPGSI